MGAMLLMPSRPVCCLYIVSARLLPWLTSKKLPHFTTEMVMNAAEPRNIAQVCACASEHTLAFTHQHHLPVFVLRRYLLTHIACQSALH
jgi:hypothetical protein